LALRINSQRVAVGQLRAGKAISRRYRNRRIGKFEFDEDHSYFMVRFPVQPDAPLVAPQQSRPPFHQELGLYPRNCEPLADSFKTGQTCSPVLTTVENGGAGRLNVVALGC